MKNSVISVFIIIAVVLCNVNAGELWCQIVNKSQKTLEQYCRNYNAALPDVCTEQIIREIDADDVIHLKIGGCDQSYVSNAVKTYDSIRSLDISHSAYTSLDWLDLRLHHLERFNASYNDIGAIPGWFFRNARRTVEIDLSYNKITTLNRDIFQLAKKLTKVHLGHNQLHADERKSLGLAQRLQYLDLSSNRYWDIPTLSENKYLIEVHLEENPIRTFTCQYMDALNDGDDDKSVRRSVYLSWKSVTSFAAEQNCGGRKMRVIGDSQTQGVKINENGSYELHCGGEQTFQVLRNFTAGNQSFEDVTEILPCFGVALETINLSDNNIQKFSLTTLKTFDHLKQIILRNTNLTQFDFNWFAFQTNINELDISENNLTKLDNFELLNSQPWERLRELNVAGNNLTNTPEIIKNLRPTLRNLNLSGNFFGQLNQSTLGHLASLETINLANTNLSIASDINPFRELRSLSILDISNNDLKMSNVTLMASTLRGLKELHAANCRFENATTVILNLDLVMKSLDLSGNSIGALHENIFENYIYLKHLNLSNANLTTLSNKTLQNQDKLQTLDLSWNCLRAIDLSIISPKLRALNLQGNNLTRIENLRRAHFPRLKSVRISRNQFDCDYLKSQMKRDWKEFTFTDNPYEQKHEENCFIGYTINAAIIGLVLTIGATAAIVSVFGPFVAAWLGCGS